MSIRHMLPLGTVQRKCIVCSYPINARSNELTAHEIACLKIPERADDALPSPVHSAPSS
jgi:hypothetical protein